MGWCVDVKEALELAQLSSTFNWLNVSHLK